MPRGSNVAGGVTESGVTRVAEMGGYHERDDRGGDKRGGGHGGAER